MQKHIPVMKKEVIEYLKPERGGAFVDCTLGSGEHGEALLCSSQQSAVSSQQLKIIGIDRDGEAIKIAKKNLAKFGDQVTFINDNFANLKQILGELGIKEVDRILFDLGVSSMQLENGERGFSFQKDAPLDMRMNKKQKKTAYEIVNFYPEKELADLIYKYGEERFSRRIAKKIIEARKTAKIETTQELVEVIKSAVPISYIKKSKINFATRTFQAIRIEVNNELKNLEKGLREAIVCLKKKGRIVVISFHSLEDRIVKQIFRENSTSCNCPYMVQCKCSDPRFKILTKKPIRPSEVERRENPKSRSAKLRAAEKL